MAKFQMNLNVNSDEDRANHVLLLTVINPAYPITCVRFFLLIKI